MNRDPAATFSRRALRLAGVGFLVAGVVALGLLGWRWRASATVDHVAVMGTRHAPPDTLRRLARVDHGAVLSELDLSLVADRVERHPWVREAEVAAQWMRGTLAITVTERTPAALAVDGRGRPTYYLDRTGHAMPLPDSTGYDVPLVRGLDADYHPIRRLAPPSLHHVLAALPKTETADLVAEIDVQPDSTVRLLTRPVGPHGAVPVRLGVGNVTRKLHTLRAFAQQVLTRAPEQAANTGAAASPEGPIEQIDLRFDRQVVTREQAPG